MFLAHQVQNSKILIRNVCTLKSKYDLTLCQSRLHTASETFICHKKNIVSGVFHIRSKHYERCFEIQSHSQIQSEFQDPEWCKIIHI